jgi:hypothetical protein
VLELAKKARRVLTDVYIQKEHFLDNYDINQIGSYPRREVGHAANEANSLGYSHAEL